MASNYPPGAEHDPLAPYNQEDVELSVLYQQKLEKTTSVLTSNPDGQWSDATLLELYEDQNRTALEVLRACEKVIEKLISDGHTWYARTWLPKLLDDLKGWDEVEEEIHGGDIIRSGASN